MFLTQKEADQLRQMPKEFDSVTSIDLTKVEDDLELPAISTDRKERFLYCDLLELDTVVVYPMKAKLSRGTL